MKIIMRSGIVALAFVFLTPMAFAATSGVSFGSLGERTSDMATFGIGVCNNGSAAITSAVPFTIVANGVSVAGLSGSPILPGSCDYIYFAYDAFNMIGGTEYTVTASSPGLTSASYTVQVPGAVLGASIVAPGAPVSQNRIQLMANEVALVQQLIALIQTALAR